MTEREAVNPNNFPQFTELFGLTAKWQIPSLKTSTTAEGSLQ
jgi:hypothetical protein